jgi:AbrB family looped-hinge helix DNA binding protein
MLRARVDAKGRITLPKPLRLRLGLSPGTVLLLRADGTVFQATTPRALLETQRAARLALRRRLQDG